MSTEDEQRPEGGGRRQGHPWSHDGWAYPCSESGGWEIAAGFHVKGQLHFVDLCMLILG